MKDNKETYVCPKTGKIIKKRKVSRIPLWFTNLIGIFALGWFLIRVIPKPKRINYPCQQVAAPVAMTFLTGVIGFLGLTAFLRNAKLFINRWRHVLLAMLVGVSLLATSCVLNKSNIMNAPDTGSSASITENDSMKSDIDSDEMVDIQSLHSAMGKGIGINPGRVAWVYDTDATSWDGYSGYWWEEQNTHTDLVEKMVKQ